MTRTEWLVARQQSVGSSDAPNLVGVGFRDPMSVYRDKTEPVDDRTPESGYLARGIELEPLVAARYRKVMDVEIIDPAYNMVPGQHYSITYHPDRPWQSASLDRRRADNGATISLKTVAGWSDEWGENGSADVPEGYRVQSQHEMGVTQTRMLDLAALNVIDWSFRVFRLDFDPDYFDWLTKVEYVFWHECVLPRTSPSGQWDHILETLMPSPRVTIRPGTIDLGDTAAALLAQRARLAKIRDDADAEHKRLTGQVEAMLGDSERGVAGSWKLRRSFVKGGRVVQNRKDYWRLTISGGKGE